MIIYNIPTEPKKKCFARMTTSYTHDKSLKKKKTHHNHINNKKQQQKRIKQN